MFLLLHKRKKEFVSHQNNVRLWMQDSFHFETASMIGLELIFKRMKSYSNNTKCEWFKICSKAQYTPDDKTSEECLCNQWQKNERCIMTEALRYFKIKDKEYIQEK